MKENKLVAIFKFIFFSIIFSSLSYALPKGFVYLSTIDPSIIEEMRYATYHNFVGRPIAGYHANKCILTEDSARALKAIQTYLHHRGFSLKVYDCYRPTKAVQDFFLWSQIEKHDEMKQEFYPRINKADLFKLEYVALKSGHSRGSTVDLTIVPLYAAKVTRYFPGQALKSCIASYKQRFCDNSLDMGTGFDCMDMLSHIDHPFRPPVGAKQNDYSREINKNRQLLEAVMKAHGFLPYEKEWWHFTLKNEPFPNTYFNFNVE